MTILRHHHHRCCRRTYKVTETHDAFSLMITFSIIGCAVVIMETVFGLKSPSVYHLTAGIASPPLHLMMRKILARLF